MLRKVLRLPRLEYTSIMNQGDFLIEVPSDRTDIPRVSWLAWEHCLMQHGSVASILVRCPIKTTACCKRIPTCLCWHLVMVKPLCDWVRAHTTDKLECCGILGCMRPRQSPKRQGGGL